MYQKLTCPLIQKKCLGEKCQWWMKFMAKDTKSNEMKDVSNCVIVKSFDVSLENLHRSVGIQQAVESSRNETSTKQDIFLSMLANNKLLER